MTPKAGGMDMNTGALSQLNILPNGGFRIMGAAGCLFASFMSGWPVHACVTVNDAIAGVIAREPFFPSNGGAGNIVHTCFHQANGKMPPALHHFTNPLSAETLIAAGQSS
jgi:hypothetical protein